MNAVANVSKTVFKVALSCRCASTNSPRLTADEKKHVEEFVNKTWSDLAGASIESLEDLFIQQWIHYKKVYSPIPE